MGAGDADDLYEVLGVSPTATDAELRQAWRALAMRWHPDRSGKDTAHIFRKLLDAYNVLADPVTRADYDRARTGAAPRRQAPGVLLSRLSRQLDSLLACGIARRDGDVIELYLDEEEVRDGGMATIPMRVLVRCSACSQGACAACGASRAIEDVFSAWLAVPPGVADGTLLRPSAQLPGVLRPVTFRVRRPAARARR